jgi:hypothetical protein
MITSLLIEDPFVFVCHRVSGTPSMTEVALTVEHTLQHSELPVLWDLRALDLDEGMSVYKASLHSLIGKWYSDMSSEKRAFVVKPDNHKDVEEVLGTLHLPWSWGVFDSWDAAIEWLQY